MSSYNQADANELAARRAADEMLLAKYKGWKPLTIWYAAWTGVLVWGAIACFGAHPSQVGLGFFALGLAVGSALYARYLYRGGLRRVWFFIF